MNGSNWRAGKVPPPQPWGQTPEQPRVGGSLTAPGQPLQGEAGRGGGQRSGPLQGRRPVQAPPLVLQRQQRGGVGAGVGRARAAPSDARGWGGGSAQVPPP